VPGREEGQADPVQGRADRPEPAIDASRGNADRQRHSGPSGGGRGRLSAGLAAAAGGLRRGVGALAGAGISGLAVLALGVAACVVLITAEFAPVYTIDVGGLPCDRVEFTLTDLCAPSGGERHSYALAILGLLALVMAWGASIGDSRPAAAALALAGAAALAIVLIGDLPDVNQTGEIGLRFDEAEASPANGFYLSLLGGALALAGGVVGLVRRR
jgi:hypothetical protein